MGKNSGDADGNTHHRSREAMSPFKVGDVVAVLEIEDVPFGGFVGRVMEVGVDTMSGEGLVFFSHETGPFKGPYDFFTRLQ